MMRGLGAVVAFSSWLLMSGCTGLPGARPVEGAVHVPDHDWAGKSTPESTTLPLIIDNNRIFTELVFQRPDGTARRALAWVNMGMGGVSVTPRLQKDLGGDGPLKFSVGGVPVTVDAAAVLPASEEDFAQQLGPMPVEATLPAGVLSRFCIRINYQAQKLDLSRACSATGNGVAVPIRPNKGTGIISVDATVFGRTYPVVIDTGGGYSWLRGEVVRGWVKEHPDILRAEGAVGESNQAMVDQPFEQEATIVRLPVLALGPVEIRNAGVLGSGPASGGLISPLIGRLFWNAWSKGAADDVAGWLGGNMLRDYELTIDYKRGLSYWNRIISPRTDDLHSVGISLIHTPEGYTIGGVVRADGIPALPDAEVGDALIAVDGRRAADMTRGTILAALYGKPGERRMLTLQRSKQRFDVQTVVGNY
jgi:hypothetical protein